MATARRSRLTLHRRRHAVRSTATPFHFFIPGGAYHPVPSRWVSVQNYTNRLRRCGYVVSSSWHCRSNRRLHSLLPQRVVFPSPQRGCGLSRGDLTQPEQGKLVQAASLHNCNQRGYFRCLEKLIPFPRQAAPWHT